MKTNSIKKVLMLSALTFAVSMNTDSFAQANLNKLKDKVKDKKEDNKSKKESSSSSTTETKVEVTGKESGEELYQKGNVAYEAGKYSEALAYYEKAEEAGYNDGEMKIKMRECRDANDPAKQKEQEDALNEGNKTLNMLEDMKYKCDNVEHDNGVSGAAHTKYMKKFVFSKTEIVKGQENEGNFTSTFNVEDNIYSRVYIDKSIINEAKSVGECNNGMPGYFIRWTFDDGKTKLPEWLNINIYNILSGSEDGIYKWTTWQPQLSWSAADITAHSIETMYFVKYMKNLSVGSHKIKMELVYDIPDDMNNGYSDYKYTTKFGPEKILAAGEFTVNVTEAGRKQLYKKVCAMYKKDIEFYNKPAVTLVSNANELVKGFTGIDWNKFTLLKVVSDFSDWTYKKNGYGIILSRSYSCGAYLLNKEDNFIYYSTVTYYQENTSSGGSTYGKTTASVEEQNIEFTRNYDSYCKECIGK